MLGQVGHDVAQFVAFGLHLIPNMRRTLNDWRFAMYRVLKRFLHRGESVSRFEIDITSDPRVELVPIAVPKVDGNLHAVITLWMRHFFFFGRGMCALANCSEAKGSVAAFRLRAG